MAVAPVVVTGPLAVNLDTVRVAGVTNTATRITLYQNAGTGFTNIGFLAVSSPDEKVSLPVTGQLIRGAQVAATQTIGEQEGCLPRAGTSVGGGANPTIGIAASIRQPGNVTGPVGSNGGGPKADIYWIHATGANVAGGYQITPSTNWQTIAFYPIDSTYLWNNNNDSFTLPDPNQYGIFEGFGIVSSDPNSTGPIDIYFDNLRNGSTLIQDFENETNAQAAVLLMPPTYSASTSANLLTAPNVSTISQSYASTGTNSLQVNFQFAGLGSAYWLRLNTGATNGNNATPNPVVDLTQPIFVDVLLLQVKATPSLTWTNPASIPYGTALGANQLNAAVTFAGTNVPGSFVYNPTNGTVLKVGTNLLTVRFTPTNTADYNFVAGTVSLIVTCPAIGLTPATLPLAAVGVAYSQNLAAAGGAAPYAFTDTAGNLPAGLSLSSSGSLSGTPSAIGTNVFTVTATDTNACTGSQAYTLIVGTAPAITTPFTSQLVECTGNASFSVSASGSPTLTYQWSVNGAVIAGATTSTLTTNNVRGAGSVYTISVLATNTYGSVTTNATLTVRDTTPPEITLNETNLLTNECHAAFVDPGATANDACAGSLPVATNSTVNPNAVGVYNITYTTTDPSGNSATNTRTVYVVDTTPPVVTLSGANPLTNECHAAFVDPGATANDACAGSVSVITTGSVNANSPGTYTLTYTATDGVNTSQQTRAVVVQDTTPPAVFYCFTNLTLSTTSNTCQALLPDLTGTNYILAVDNCSSVTVTQKPPPSTVLPLGTNLVTFTVFDSSGNSTNCAVAVAVVGVPGITMLTTNVAVAIGSNATFSVNVCGTAPFVYQWYYNTNTPLANASNAVLTLTSISTNDLGNYQVVVTNSYGSATSAVATLSIIQPPNITRQPVSLVRAPGSSAVFTVSAKGSTPMYYQWYMGTTNGVPLVGQTNAALSITNIQSADFANYTALVSNGSGAVASAQASLVLAQSPTISSVSFNLTTFTLGFPTEAGPNYKVEYKHHVDDPSWQTLTAVSGTGNPITITDNAQTNMMRFYRIHVE